MELCNLQLLICLYFVTFSAKAFSKFDKTAYDKSQISQLVSTIIGWDSVLRTPN